MGFVPCLVVLDRGRWSANEIHLGHPLLDAFLEFVAGRARWNTVLATAFDLKVFFSIVDTDPAAVTTADVLAFIQRQRAPRRGATVVRIEDGEPGLAARTIKRRLATIAGLYEYLIVRGDTGVTRNPVPRGLALRRPGQRAVRGVPLIRAPRTLPRVINPDEVDALMAALRTRRDRAMVEAMLLGGLRRCEVLGLRLEDLRPGDKRVFIAEGKGGHQRIVPLSSRFFISVAAYLEIERPRPVVNGSRVRRVERTAPRPAADAPPGWTRSSPAPARAPGWRGSPVTSSATRASRGSEKPAWPWRPSRPRPGIGRSSPPGSICTSPTTGSPGSIDARPRRSTPRRRRARDARSASAVRRSRSTRSTGSWRPSARPGSRPWRTHQAGGPDLLRAAPAGGRLGAAVPRPAARGHQEGADVRRLADGHRPAHRHGRLPQSRRSPLGDRRAPPLP